MESKFDKVCRETWLIKVPIKNDKLKTLPFEQLQSRCVLGTMLGYVNVMQGVVFILQRLSHKTRAYIWNANGLPGFLVKAEEILWILE